MFFLLASFMMVSLSQVHVKGIKLNLPTGISGQTQSRREYVALSVDKDGEIYYDKTKVEPNDVYEGIERNCIASTPMPRFSFAAIAMPTTAISCD